MIDNDIIEYLLQCDIGEGEDPTILFDYEDDFDAE